MAASTYDISELWHECMLRHVAHTFSIVCFHTLDVESAHEGQGDVPGPEANRM